MEPMEVIDLSSDDENSAPKDPGVGSSFVTETKTAVENGKDKVDVKDSEMVSNPLKNKKRTADDSNQSFFIKRIKLTDVTEDSKTVTISPVKTSENTVRRLATVKSETLSPSTKHKILESNLATESKDKSSPSIRTYGNATKLINNDSRGKSNPESDKKGNSSNLFKINEGASSSRQTIHPQLLVKNKVKVSESTESAKVPSAEIFELFLQACRSQDSSEDMEKIISKIKKRYTNLEPAYATSGSFIQLIRQKTKLILDNRSKLFLHISEIRDEMKARQVTNRPLVKGKMKSNVQRPGISTQSWINDIPEANSVSEPEALAEEESKYSEKLRVLEKAMRRCEHYINKCEMAEVDFDDEKDSHYILAEKYKYRMVELYNEYCEITGERADAARPYLRPKHLSVTPLPLLNNAITSFINMKIKKMNKFSLKTKKKREELRLADALIFPDYMDILNCVKKCNEEQNLQISKSKQEVIAKTAFEDLGKHLQRCRQADYYDTFSLFLEKGDGDPALKDKSLAEKLKKNEEIGSKKLDQVFADFVIKQNAIAKNENGEVSESDNSKDSDDDNSESSTNDALSVTLDIDPDESNTNDIVLELEDNLNQEGNDNVELGKVADENKEIKENGALNEETHVGKDSRPVEKIEENTIDVDCSQVKVVKIPDNLEISKEMETEIISSKSLSQETKKNVEEKKAEEKVEETVIEKLINETAGPSNIEQTAPSTSLIQEPASTVATCKVNLVQATETMEMNVNNGCVPAISAKNTEGNVSDKTTNVRQRALYLGDTKSKIRDVITIEKHLSIPVLKNGNNRDIGLPIINEKKVFVQNTCAFDSIFQLVLAATFDFGKVFEIVQSLEKTEKFFELVRYVKEKGIDRKAYQIRANILKDYYGIEKDSDIPEQFTMRCEQNVGFLAERIFSAIPSYVEIINCSKGCYSNEEQFTSYQVPITVLHENLEQLIVRVCGETTKDSACTTNKCTGVRKRIHVIVIDVRAVTTTEKLKGEEEEKKPILRVRPFAIPPGSWKDFQSPTKEIIINTRKTGTAGADTEAKKIDFEILPVEEKRTMIKINKPNPVGKTVQVKSDVLMDLKNKKSTVMIPTNFNTSNPQINVKTVTNNVTFNFNNQVQSRSKVTSVISCQSKLPQNLFNIDESGKIVVNATSNKEKTDGKSNPTRTTPTNSRQIFPGKNSVQRIVLVGQEASGPISPQRIKIISPKRRDQLDSIIRQIPAVNERGKKVLFVQLRHQVGAERQNIIPGKSGAVENETTHSRNKQPDANSSEAASSNSKPRVLNSTRKIDPSNVPSRTPNEVDKVHKTSVKSVPTIVIE